MKRIKSLYRRHERLISRVIFPCLLFFYPLTGVARGVDMSDSAYSLTNFLFFPELEGFWVISTYVANLLGWVLMKLPFGGSLLGMRIYTGLAVSLTVLLAYELLRKWMPSWIVFLGEAVAVGFLWIPTTLLYNYLTYLFFSLGALLLYKGLVEEKNGWLAAAGACLGLNIFVRIPNVTECALILGLWYYLASAKRPAAVILRKTFLCIGGYVAGFALPLTLVLLHYGAGGLADALSSLAGIQNVDAGYSPSMMILSALRAYGRSFKWMGFGVAAMVLGMALFAFQKGKWERGKKLLFLLGQLVLLRFLWGRGMFSFRYYEDYTAMYEWGMTGLYLAWIAAGWLLFSSRTAREEKLWGVLSMAILALTPLGSNNYTYQNLNNLFIIAPVTLYAGVKLYRYRPGFFPGAGACPLSGLSFPVKAAAAVAGGMILIQSVGFHLGFSFRDGMDGTPRDYRISSPAALRYMYTTEENGKALEGLAAWLEGEGLDGQELLLYGDCPGLSYVFGLPPAISTSWPYLDSYRLEDFSAELEALDTYPIVICRIQEMTNEAKIKKQEVLYSWMADRGYGITYENEGYQVYTKR